MPSGMCLLDDKTKLQGFPVLIEIDDKINQINTLLTLKIYQLSLKGYYQRLLIDMYLNKGDSYLLSLIS